MLCFIKVKYVQHYFSSHSLSILCMFIFLLNLGRIGDSIKGNYREGIPATSHSEHNRAKSLQQAHRPRIGRVSQRNRKETEAVGRSVYSNWNFSYCGAKIKRTAFKCVSSFSSFLCIDSCIPSSTAVRGTCLAHKKKLSLELLYFFERT